MRRAFRNIIFIEPEPDAGGAREVFRRCADRLPDLKYTVWNFEPPFDRLFRLTPYETAREAIYAYTEDPKILTPLHRFAREVKR